MLDYNDKNYISKIYKKTGAQEVLSLGQPTKILQVSEKTVNKLKALRKKCEHDDIQFCSDCQSIDEIVNIYAYPLR